MFGRQKLFFLTVSQRPESSIPLYLSLRLATDFMPLQYMALTAFNAGAAGAQNIQTLLILRFFAGTFGSSPLTNSGGVIADMFSAKGRGLANAIFASVRVTQCETINGYLRA